MKNEYVNIKGANMDIDLLPSTEANWEIGKCPWNEDENSNEHKCAVKNTSICKYFLGLGSEGLDTIKCSYPNERK